MGNTWHFSRNHCTSIGQSSFVQAVERDKYDFRIANSQVNKAFYANKMPVLIHVSCKLCYLDSGTDVGYWYMSKFGYV